MLKRIAIKGFKSFVDVELELPRLVVLAGPNAAGKSNMLDAIQMLARTGTQRTLADALSDPIRGFPAEAFTFPPGALPELLEKRTARFSMEADLDIATDNDASPELARYRVGIEIIPDTGVLSLADEYLASMTKGWQTEKGNARIETSGQDVYIRRSGGGGHPRHERLGVNHAYLSDTRLSGTSYPLFDAVRHELASWRTHYLDPQSAMRAAAPPREVLDIGVRGEHLAPFLYGLKARSPQQFKAIRRALREVIPAVTDLDVDLDTKRGTLDIQVEQSGTVFSSRVISEGTLRVLALCAISVTATRELIAFEEPENGVQPQRLDRIAELLTAAALRKRAQIVVTTHSPGFIAAVLARASENPDLIGIFGVAGEGRATVIRPIPDPGLWAERAIDELLTEPDDYDKTTALIRRGWLDL